MLVPDPPLLEIFYAPTCAPCVLELPAIARFQKTRPDRLRIILISDFGRALSDLAAISPELAARAVKAASSQPRDTLRLAGNDDAILPYARAVDARGHICARWRGTLTIERMNNMLRACPIFTEQKSLRP